MSLVIHLLCLSYALVTAGVSSGYSLSLAHTWHDNSLAVAQGEAILVAFSLERVVDILGYGPRHEHLKKAADVWKMAQRLHIHCVCVWGGFVGLIAECLFARSCCHISIPPPLRALVGQTPIAKHCPGPTAGPRQEKRPLHTARAVSP